MTSARRERTIRQLRAAAEREEAACARLLEEIGALQDKRMRALRKERLLRKLIVRAGGEP